MPSRRRKGVAVAAWSDRPAFRCRDIFLGLLIGAIAIPANVLFIITEPEARIGARRRPAARRIFPFRFRRQPLRFARLLRQPVRVGPGVVPAHIIFATPVRNPSPIGSDSFPLRTLLQCPLACRALCSSAGGGPAVFLRVPSPAGRDQPWALFAVPRIGRAVPWRRTNRGRRVPAGQ